MQEPEEAYWELMEETMESEFMSNLMCEETSDSPVSYPFPDEDDDLPF